jgi:hypothetical protein
MVPRHPDVLELLERRIWKLVDEVNQLRQLVLGYSGRSEHVAALSLEPQQPIHSGFAHAKSSRQLEVGAFFSFVRFDDPSPQVQRYSVHASCNSDAHHIFKSEAGAMRRSRAPSNSIRGETRHAVAAMIRGVIARVCASRIAIASLARLLTVSCEPDKSLQIVGDRAKSCPFRKRSVRPRDIDTDIDKVVVALKKRSSLTASIVTGAPRVRLCVGKINLHDTGATSPEGYSHCRLHHRKAGERAARRRRYFLHSRIRFTFHLIVLGEWFVMLHPCRLRRSRAMLTT